MPEEGKIYDILVEDRIVYDFGTEQQKFIGFIVWADDGLADIILAVPGVTCVTTKPNSRNRYDAFLDPRYDPEWVGAEIEAQLRIHAPID